MSSESGFREFMRSGNGKIVAGVLVLVAFLAMAWSIRSNFSNSSSVDSVENPLFISAGSGATFHQRLEAGLKFPVKSPSGQMDGYPAEMCYWTKDGTGKTDPTPVLLNELVGKPGPTFCPDCGRLIVHHNPSPGPGVHAPPTKEQYMSRYGSR